MTESPNSQRHEPIFDKYGEGYETRSSADTSITPPELSPPDSPRTKSGSPATIDSRVKSRSLAATLSLEEQVCVQYLVSLSNVANHIKVSLLVAADFWRSKAIPEKGIPAFKTSDGPNGARGGIFTAGTKVSD